MFILGGGMAISGTLNFNYFIPHFACWRFMEVNSVQLSLPTQSISGLLCHITKRLQFRASAAMSDALCQSLRWTQ